MIRSLGFDCVHVEYQAAGKHSALRVFIDGENGVTVDDCAVVSRQLGVVLDVEDIVPGAYHLEVSSPGLDRVLGSQADFEAQVGEEVRIQSKEAIDGRRRWAGKLERVEDGKIVVSVDGQAHSIPVGVIRRANVRYGFDANSEGAKR